MASPELLVRSSSDVRRSVVRGTSNKHSGKAKTQLIGKLLVTCLQMTQAEHGFPSLWMISGRVKEPFIYLFIFNLEEKPQTMFDFVEQN